VKELSLKFKIKSQLKMASVDGFFKQFVDEPDNEMKILGIAGLELTGKDLGVLKKRIEGKKTKDKKGGGGGGGSKPEKKPEVLTPKTSVAGGGGSGEEGDVRDLAAEQKLVERFWEDLEKMDPVTLLSEDVLDAFKYIGFSPDVVLREILHRGQVGGRSSDQIKKDMVDMITIAIIKGSVTEKNLLKTSDAGKVVYKNLQTVYQLETGGAKGKDSTHLTAARVAAAVPGMVIQVLIKRPEFAKTFVGPFGSKSLPAYLRHQAAAACIPECASEKLKEYLIALITAFTADQTKALAKSKDTPADLFDTQLNYVQTTFSGNHPTETLRQRIFKSFSLSSDYEKLSIVADRIKKVKPDFVSLTLQELDAELAK
jgi:hypothetical protein